MAGGARGQQGSAKMYACVYVRAHVAHRLPYMKVGFCASKYMCTPHVCVFESVCARGMFCVLVNSKVCEVLL